MRKRGLMLGAALSASVVLAACSFGPDYPEFGAASYRIEGVAADPAGGQAIQTVVWRDGAQRRIDTILPGRGQVTIVFDDASKAAYVLSAPTAAAQIPGAALATTPAAGAQAPATTPIGAPTGQTAPAPAAPVQTPPAQVPPAQTAPATPGQAAPSQPVIQATGVAVRLPDDEIPAPVEAAWATLGEKNADYVGECAVAGVEGGAWRPNEAPTGGAARTACITEDGIVLEVTEGATVLWRATRLDRGPLDASLFGVPAGYQIIDPQAVADSVTDTLNEVGQVAGDAPPANTAATLPKK